MAVWRTVRRRAVRTPPYILHPRCLPHLTLLPALVWKKVKLETGTRLRGCGSGSGLSQSSHRGDGKEVTFWRAMKEGISKGMWRVPEGESPRSHPPFYLGPMDGVAICWDRKARRRLLCGRVSTGYRDTWCGVWEHGLQDLCLSHRKLPPGRWPYASLCLLPGWLCHLEFWPLPHPLATVPVSSTLFPLLGIPSPWNCLPSRALACFLSVCWLSTPAICLHPLPRSRAAHRLGLRRRWVNP